MIKNLKSGNLNYATVGEFLADLKKEFSSRDDEVMKVVELKKVEQDNERICT